MRFIPILILLVILTSCQTDEQGDIDEYTTTVLSDYEVLIDFESQKLLQPAQVEMVGDERLIISDFGSFSLKKFDTQGTMLNEFGREGDGPGEFRSPTSLTVDGDDVYVFDNQNQNFVRFSTDGEFVSSITHEYDNLMFGSHTVKNGYLYSTKGGANNALLARFDQDGNRLESFGEPIGELSDDFGEIMQSSISQAENEEIPDALKNAGILTHADETVWMSMSGRPRIYQITGDDNFTGFDFEVERKEKIENEFFEAMAQMEQPALMNFQYVTDLVATSEYLYLLNVIRDEEEPAVIYQVSNEGQITNRFKLEDQTANNYRMAISSDDNYLYLTKPDEASLLRYRL